MSGSGHNSLANRNFSISELIKQGYSGVLRGPQRKESDGHSRMAWPNFPTSSDCVILVSTILNNETRSRLRDLHTVPGTTYGKLLFDTTGFIACSIVGVLSWRAGWYPLTLLAVLVGGHFGHIKPLAFHDAAHQTLTKESWLNEFIGVLTGIVILVPLCVYRRAHSLHHSCLLTKRDPEMWPFTDPDSPRVVRLLAAFSEIVFGFVYTPLLFMRSAIKAEKPPQNFYRTAVRDYFLMVVFWGGVCWLVNHFGFWTEFIIGYLAQVAVAGAYQTLNKYTQHMGMTGSTVLELTRNVDDRRPRGRLMSFSMQHTDHHGTHHRYAKIPFQNLPEGTELVYGSDSDSAHNYPSYLSAMLAMARTLPDPKAGPQWNELHSADEVESTEAESTAANA